VLRNIAEGIEYAAKTPLVFFVIMMGNVFSLCGMPYLSMLPVFAEDVLGQGATGLGFLASASGAGAVVGGVLLARWGNVQDKRRLFEACYLLFFGALILFSLSRSYPLSLVLLFAVGLGSMSNINTGTVMLQLATPRALQGRTMSLWTWGISLSFLGALPVGALAEAVGMPAAMATSAALGLAGGLGLIAWYRWSVQSPESRVQNREGIEPRR
jgi:predicted MFS family arabinose efflux permease